MKYYAAINDDYLGKSIRDGSLAIFEEKKDAERVCSKMDYDLIEVSVVKHEKYIRLTEENAKLREMLEIVSPAVRSYYKSGYFNGTSTWTDFNNLLNQLKGQNNDK